MAILIYDSNGFLPTAPNSSPPSNVDGWTDGASAWSVTSNTFVPSNNTFPTNALYRPTSEGVASFRMIVNYNAAAASGNNWAFFIPSAADVTKGYLIFGGLGNSAPTIHYYPGNTNITNGSGNVSLTTGGTGTTFNVPTVITVDIVPNATSGNDVTLTEFQGATLVRSLTLVGDTHVPVSSWRAGISSVAGAIPVSRVQTFNTTTAPGFGLSPLSDYSNGANIVVTATGNGNTVWTGSTTFSVSGGTGASIVSQSINTGTQVASLTINPGTAAGVLSISNNTDSPSVPQNFTVNTPSFTVAGGSVVVNTTGNTLTLVGTGTNWTSGTNFTLTTTTGATLATSTPTVFTDARHLTLTLNAGASLGSGTISYVNTTGTIVGTGGVTISAALTASWVNRYPTTGAKSLVLTSTIPTNWVASPPTASWVQGLRGNVNLTLGSVTIGGPADGNVGQTATFTVAATTTSHGMFSIYLTNVPNGALLAPDMRVETAAIFVNPSYPVHLQPSLAVTITGINTLFVTDTSTFSVGNFVGFTVNPSLGTITRVNQTTVTTTMNTGTLTGTSGTFDVTDSGSGAVWPVTVYSTGQGIAGGNTQVLFSSPVGNFLDGRKAATKGTTAYTTIQWFRGATFAAATAAGVAGTSPLVDGNGILGSATFFLDDESTTALTGRNFYVCKVNGILGIGMVGITMQSTLNLCFWGDSITVGVASYLANIPPMLQSLLGYRNIITGSYGVSGSGLVTAGGGGGSWTASYAGGTNYANALAQARSQAANVIHIMLGTNDAIYGGPTSAAAYLAGLQSIIAQIKIDLPQCKIVFSFSPYRVIVSADTANDALISYQTQILSVVDNITVFLGARDTYNWYAEAYGGGGLSGTYLSDGTHPTTTPTQTLTVINGYGELANIYLIGLVRAFLPTTGTILALTITNLGGSSRKLDWIADPLATSYKVLRSSDGVNYAVIANPAAGTLTYTDTARPGGNVYYEVAGVH